MGSYLPDLASVKAASIIPEAVLDEFEGREPGRIVARAALVQAAEIDARLRKRYDVPFELPYPAAVIRWLGALVDAELYLMIGINPTDLEQQRIKERADAAQVAIAAAADAVAGLYDLPLRADTTSTGISEPRTLASSDYNPWAFQRRMRELGRNG